MMRQWIILMVCMTACTCFGIQDSPLNVDVYFGWDGCYKPMEWMPVEINISSTLKDPFAGMISLLAQQDGLSRLSVGHEFVLTPQMPLYIPLSTKLNYAAETCSISITNTRGRTFWANDFQLWDYSKQNRSLTPVGESDVLIGLVGRGQFGLMTLTDKVACRSGSGQGELYVKDKLPRAMPWDWTGYVCLDALILYDLQWDSLRSEQWKALTRWVSNGGRLFIILGGNPLPADCPLLEITPLQISAQKTVEIDPVTLNKWTNKTVSSVSIPAWPLKLRQNSPLWNMTNTIPGQGVFALGWAGFGKVAVLSFDPELLPGELKASPEKLWVSWLGGVLEQPAGEAYQKAQKEKKKNPPEMPGMPEESAEFEGLMVPPELENTTYVKRLICKDELPEAKEDKNKQNRSYNYRINPGFAAANQLMEFLYDIPQMRPLSVWWVILLLILLAVLLGPVDYVVLKRMDRLPWTWVTCAFWIVVFSAGSYYGVQALRAGQMQIRAVSVTDGFAGGLCWNTSYFGIFSPGSESYQPVNLKPAQWWSGAAPTQEYVYAYSREQAMRTIYCMQHDGGNLPYIVPIHIWTMQNLLLEEPVAGMPLSADVLLDGEQVELSIVNNASQPIKKGTVLLKNGFVFEFKTIGAGENKKFSGTLKRAENWLDQTQYHWGVQGYYQVNNRQSRSPDYITTASYWAQGTRQRSEAMRAYLDAGAAIVCVEYEQPPIPFGLKDQTFGQNHLYYVRQVVFVENK